MTAYLAKSTNSLSFDVTKDEQLIGKLNYQSWFKFNAVIEMANGSNYLVEPKGFWGTTIECKDREKVLLKFKMNWNGAIVIQTFFNDNEKGYVFKHRGIFKESFILTDQDDTELLVMKPHLQWFKSNYEYQVTASGGFEIIPQKELLVMISVHCANYYMAMMMAAVPGVGM